MKVNAGSDEDSDFEILDQRPKSRKALSKPRSALIQSQVHRSSSGWQQQANYMPAAEQLSRQGDISFSPLDIQISSASYALQNAVSNSQLEVSSTGPE